MESSAIKNYGRTDWLLSYLDILPVFMMIVDEDMRLAAVNRPMRDVFGLNLHQALHRRTGDALNCINSIEEYGGCGGGPDCATCEIRNSVNRVFAGGQIVRRRSQFTAHGGERIVKLDVIITAAPVTFEGRSLVALVLEDVSDMAALQDLLSICANCKKIRVDKINWQSLETYFKEHNDIDFSHGICPDCARKFYGAE